MSLLVLALPEDPLTDQPLDFLVLVGEDVVDAGRAPAAALPQVPDREHQVVALAPPRALSWHAVQLPPGVGAPSSRLRPVLEGLLEDQLLDPPGDLHLALAGEGGSGSRWVAACQRRWLAMAVQGLEAAGCRLSRVLPEWQPGTARLHLTGTPESAQMLLCSPQGVSLLALTPENLAWAWPPDARAGVDLSADPDLLEWAREHLGPDVRPWPRAERWALAARPRWDLARGLRMRRQASRSPLEWFRAPRWRAARWATLGLAAVNLVGFNALAWSHSVQLQARREQMRQMVVQTFPQAQTAGALEPPEQMQREIERLRAASAQATPDDLAVMLGAVLPALPADRPPQALSYSPGQLRLHGMALTGDASQALARELRLRGYSAHAQGPDLLIRTLP